jgi:transcription antitermination factor NusG
MWPATAGKGIMAAEDNYHAIDTSWFAVWTRSRQEKVAAAMLEALGVPHFLPLRSEVHRWSDRKQTVTIPLFSGYLFVRLNPNKDSRLRVLNLPGIAGLVGSQAGPLPIPDYEIENIRTVIAQKMQYSTYPEIPIGNRVRVVRGSLAGIEGTLLRTQTDSKLVLSIELIQQSIAVSIHASDVEPIGPRYSPTLQENPAVSIA